MLVGFVAGIGGSIAIGLISAAVPTAGMWGFAVLILFFFLLYFGYFALFEIIWNGQTPGKRKAGIRVIKDSGRPLTPAESIGRNLMRIVDWLPAFYAVGMVSAILTKENKRLGDLVAGSLVVRESSFSTLKPAWQTGDAPIAPGFSPMGADRLSPEECALIDSYLNRRLDLEPYLRLNLRCQQTALSQPSRPIKSWKLLLTSVAPAAGMAETRSPVSHPTRLAVTNEEGSKNDKRENYMRRQKNEGLFKVKSWSKILK